MADGEDAYLVLYVDDEWPNRVVFEKTFGKRFRVLTVGSGEEALAIFEAQRVAVIVSDQRMPGMSGNELLKHVKHHYPETIRVVVTAYSDLDPILRAVNDGLVVRYVVKPWVRSEFEEILNWSVEAYAQEQEQSSLQVRLLNAERLITIGSIASTVFHDLAGTAQQLKNNAERLGHFMPSIPELRRILDAHAASLPSPHRENLLALAEELPEIVGDLSAGSEFVGGLSGSMRRLFKPPPEGPTPTEPVHVIRYALGVFRAASHVDRSYEGPEPLPRVKMGCTELTQIFINLISNALAALPAPPIRGGHLKVSASQEGDQVRFVVSDNGSGMTPEVLTSAGTLYFSTRLEGAGLGLAQCRRLIEGNGGEMRIESAPGDGTRVIFTIPKAE